MILNLLEELVKSLELYEHEWAAPVPSRQIINVLRLAFLDSPEAVDQVLAAAMIQARPAVQGDLIGSYTLTSYAIEHVEPSKLSKALDVATHRLMSWIQENRLALPTRIDALQALESLCEKATPRDLSNLEALFGYLAIVSSEKDRTRTSTCFVAPRAVE